MGLACNDPITCHNMGGVFRMVHGGMDGSEVDD